VETPSFGSRGDEDEEEESHRLVQEMKERFGQGISQPPLLQRSLTEELAHGVDVTVSAFSFWFAFWKVPIIRFISHAFMNVLMLVFNVLVVVGINPSLATKPSWLTPVEIAFYITLFGRVEEEFQQLYKNGHGYFYSFWNKVDLLTLSLQCSAFGLRMLEMLPRNASTAMVEIQFDIQVWGLLFFALRSTEFLNFNPKLGEVFLILCEMMKETVWVFFYMLFFSFWAGVALSTGQQQAKYLEENRYDTDMRHWGMAGLWAILGENLEYVGEFYRLSSDRRNLFNWYPFLLFLSGLLTSVFMVNLLIAMMTSTYERIRSESQYWCATQYCETAIEFKDERGLPPPLNVLTRPLSFANEHVLSRLSPAFKKMEKSGDSRGFMTPMNPKKMIRITALERQYANAFDQQMVHDATMSSEARVASIADKMPLVETLVQRTETLEDALGSIADTLKAQQTLLERILKDTSPEPNGSNLGAGQRAPVWNESRERGQRRRNRAPLAAHEAADVVADKLLRPPLPIQQSRRPLGPTLSGQAGGVAGGTGGAAAGSCMKSLAATRRSHASSSRSLTG